MDDTVISEASRRSTISTAKSNKGQSTQDQHDKVSALQQLMCDHFRPLPPQLQSLIRILQRKDNTNDLIERNPEYLYCVCFLVSREWDVQKAFAMMKDVVTYRAANHLDEHSQLPPAVSVRGWDDMAGVCASLGKTPRKVPGSIDHLVADLRRVLSCGIHYWDKGGRPVVYVMVDSLDERGLIETLKRNAKIGQNPADVLWTYGQHFIGVAEDLALNQIQQKRASAKEGQKASSPPPLSSNSFAQGLITLVMDLKGFHIGMLWKPMLDLFRDVARQFFQYYPDMVHRIIAINAPGIVRVAFNLVKGVMPVGFQRKISFVGPPRTMEVLKEEIDAAYIPNFLGGNCRCYSAETEVGGDAVRSGNNRSYCCIDGYDRDDPLRKRSKAKNQPWGEMYVNKNSGALPDGEEYARTEDIALPVGETHQRVFPLKPSETVVWEFAVSHDGKGVAFTVYFIPQIDTSAAGKSETRWAKLSHKNMELHRVQECEAAKHSDEFTATVQGTLVLSWRNTRWFFKPRSVQLRVYKGAAPPPTVEEEEEYLENKKRDAVPS